MAIFFNTGIFKGLVKLIRKLKHDKRANTIISTINARSESFSFLEDEPDLYSISDCKK